MIPDSPWWVTLLVAVPILVLGAGRLTRVIYFDAFPPTAWLRSKWDLLTEKSDWNLLMHCPWCLSHWVIAGGLAWFALGFAWPILWPIWYVFFGWFALSYLTAMIIVRDEPADDE